MEVLILLLFFIFHFSFYIHIHIHIQELSRHLAGAWDHVCVGESVAGYNVGTQGVSLRLRP